ncbi:hypothetical protein Gohar_018558 [Gossypium harknessii]|uniref:Uncharacterized protein n=1 Tax=Gossypium harknessii TaxID=34285 RepID=A0A7J9GA72_9ROSI|nr:hypothetical protein [Gossypium harknessii]
MAVDSMAALGRNVLLGLKI